HYVSALCSTGSVVNVSINSEAYNYFEKAYPNEKITPGRIIRFYEENNQVLEFGPVAMFKTPEKATVADLAEKTPEIMPPQNNRALCPTTRLFGWTPAKEQDGGPKD